MERIKSKLEKLEIQFLDMQKSIEQMKELVSEGTKSDVDYSYIEKYAKSNKFITHNIANEEKEIIYKYCCCLAAVVELTNVIEQKVKQYYHVFRIYHTCMEEEVYEDLIRDSKTISVEELLFLKENLQPVYIQNFLVDMLLMISFDENKNEKQMDYFCEVVGLLGTSQKELEQIMQIVKAILLTDEEMLLKCAFVSDINGYYAYLGFVSEYFVITKFKEILTASSNKILVYGGELKDINEVVDMDGYGKKEIYFKNCKFENILGIWSEETITRYKNCVFLDCKQEKLKTTPSWSDLKYENGNPQKFFMNGKNIYMENTEFINCTLLGVGQQSSVLKLMYSTIKKCKFKNCKIGISVRSAAAGAVLDLKNTSVEECIFEGCEAYGEGTYGRFDHFYMRIVYMIQGRITNTKFIDCRSSSQYVSDGTDNNYILLFDDRCKEDSNDFINCYAEQSRNFGSNRSHDLKGSFSVK